MDFSETLSPSGCIRLAIIFCLKAGGFRKMKNTRKIVESAVMLALATALSVFTVIKFPFGGSVTLMSQLPIILIAYRYGTKWGITTGVVMGVLQMILGADNFSYVTGIGAIIILIFSDYLIAFGALGLGGIFRKRLHNPALELALGSAVASVIRFLCHFISGVTIWSGYAPETQGVIYYSLTYNGSYMLPEMIITIVGAVIIGLSFDLLSPEIKVRKRTGKAD